MHNMKKLEAEFKAQINPGNLKEAMAAAGASSNELWKIPYNQLRIIKDFNIRVHNAKYKEKVEEYAESLFTGGWLAHKPMAGLVQRDEKTGEDHVYIFDGHTRLLAIEIANKRLAKAGLPLISEVTVIAVPSKKNKSKEPISMTDLTVAMIQGNKGNDHSAYEYAIACKRLADAQVPVAEIARRLGLSREWAKNLLMLMSAPEELRQRVADEALTVTLAVQLLQEHGAAAAEMVEEAAAAKEAEGVPVKLTRKNIKPNSPFTKAIKRAAPQMYTALEKLQGDKGFARLSTETREMVLALIEEVSKSKDDGAVDHSKQATIFDAVPGESGAQAAA